MTDNDEKTLSLTTTPSAENIPAANASAVDEARTAKSDTAKSDTAARNPAPPINTPNPAPSSPPALPSSQNKGKPKVRRSRPRRRAASSDVESDEQAASDNSLTENSASESETDSDEEDEDAVEDAIGDHHSVSAGSGHSRVDAKPKPVFAGADTTTPAAWTDLHSPMEEISFEDFNRGGRGKSIRGRGRGRGAAVNTEPRERTQSAGVKEKKPSAESAVKKEPSEVTAKKVPAEPKEKKEFTDAQKKKYEEKKARMKERQKAKKAAAREVKDKEKVTPKTSNGNGEMQPPLARSASAAKLDDGSAQMDSVGRDDKPALAASLEVTRKDDGPTAPVVSSQEHKVPSSFASAQPAIVAGPKTAKNKPAKGKGKNKSESESQLSIRPLGAPASPLPPNIDALVASTSSLTADDPSESIAASEQLQQSTPPAAAAESSAEDWAAPMSPSERPRPPRVNNREAYAQRIAEDPKFTPRVGQFWTHDQRHYDAGPVGDGGYSGLRQMSDYWRGRGSPRGGFRGGFRGRARGGFGPQSPLGRSDNHGEEISPAKGSNRRAGPKLAMDRVEIELEEARDRARAAKAQIQVQNEPEDDGWPTEPTELSAISPPPPPPAENKWGHEAYEAARATEQFHSQSTRGGFRARGRGRGVGRGGHFNPPPIHPAAGLPTPVATPEPPASAASASLPFVNASNPTEELLTQPAAEDLLATSTEAVTVRLPGADSAAAVPAPRALTPHELATNGLVIPMTSPVPTGQDRPYTPSAPVDSIESYPQTASLPIVPIAPAPFPKSQTFVDAPAPVASPQYASITGSENGSMSSSGHFVPQQFQALPPGVGMGPNGDFYNLASGAPVEFHPPVPTSSMRNFFAAQPGGFQPQQGFAPVPSYSPDPFAQQQRGPFSAGPVPSPQAMYFPSQQGPLSANGMNGYPDGRGSPFGNPYALSNGQTPNGQVSGYFAPARQSSRVVIRAPSGDTGERAASSSPAKTSGLRLKAAANGFTPQGRMPANGAANGGLPFASVQQGYYSQHYNPYTGMNGYDVVDSNGSSGMMANSGGGDGMVQGQQQGMFYPEQSQYGWQQQQEAYAMAAYGYSGGEYPGY